MLAVRERGLPLRKADYADFRDDAHIAADDDNFALPSAGKILSTLGTLAWRALVLQVVEADPTLGTREEVLSDLRRPRRSKTHRNPRTGHMRLRFGDAATGPEADSTASEPPDIDEDTDDTDHTDDSERATA